MEQQLNQLKAEMLQKIEEAANLKALNEVRVAYLGKKRTNYRFTKRDGEAIC